jgi:predicted MFS family arabinose efflux permease
LPAVVVLALDAYGWRQTWVVAGGVAILLLPPSLLVLLARARTSRPVHGEPGSAARGLRRREVLLSVRFVLLLPAMLTTGFVITALFFHQGALSAANGWPDGWFAACIPAYAAASVVAALGAGFRVDRWGARRALPVFMLPLAGAVLMLTVTSAPALGMVALALAGLTAGSSNTVVTVGLSELYGSGNLAVVRSLAASAMIVASALSPALVGIALDLGATMTAALLACLVLILAAGPLAARGIARTPPTTRKGEGP